MTPPSRASQVAGSIEFPPGGVANRVAASLAQRAATRSVSRKYKPNLRNRSASSGRCAQARGHGQAAAARARAISWQSDRSGPRPAQPPLSAPRHARKPAAERRERIDDHRKLHENNGIQSEIAMYDDSQRLQRGGWKLEADTQLVAEFADDPAAEQKHAGHENRALDD